MTQLLVSVRSVVEAQTALAGGAALIDVKEPSRGSLGRADDETIAAVVRFVSGRRLVSAALGELADRPSLLVARELRFVKWGLAGCASCRWHAELSREGAELRHHAPQCHPVAVAYADWQRAAAPRPAEIADFAVQNSWPVVLFDTWRKDGTTLFDWLPVRSVAELRQRCDKAGVRVALAGSLGLKHLDKIRELQPDWLAVRGSVCRDGKRTETLDPVRIARLAKALAGLSLTSAIAAD